MFFLCATDKSSFSNAVMYLGDHKTWGSLKVGEQQGWNLESLSNICFGRAGALTCGFSLCQREQKWGRDNGYIR